VKELGILVFDVDPLFSTQPERWSIFFYPFLAHYTSQGYGAVAKCRTPIYRKIRGLS
jgi:hypothetical protein